MSPSVGSPIPWTKYIAPNRALRRRTARRRSVSEASPAFDIAPRYRLGMTTRTEDREEDHEEPRASIFGPPTSVGDCLKQQLGGRPPPVDLLHLARRQPAPRGGGVAAVTAIEQK